MVYSNEILLFPPPGNLVFVKIQSLLFFATLSMFWLWACHQESPEIPTVPSPSDEKAQPSTTSSRHWLAPEELADLWPRGRWVWDCKPQQGPDGQSFNQQVLLEVSGKPEGNQVLLEFLWSFLGPGGSGHEPASDQIYWSGNSIQDQAPLWELIPHQRSPWHGIINWAPGPHPSSAPFPFPVVHLPNSSSDHIMEFLKGLTANLFDSTTCHWPKFPIPVRIGNAHSGQVNLSDCLVEAIQRWNNDEIEPWFQINETAGWGVQLVHFPGVIMHPPLQARITRLDDEGRPLRVQILVGDNYSTPAARPYAVRGFVHELGHALFLWGHSSDRNHVLWGTGPPLVDHPSSTERKAAQLMHSLPEGLDLKKYISEP